MAPNGLGSVLESGGVRRVTLLVSRNGSLQLVPEEGADGGGPLNGLGALLATTFAGGLALNVLLLLALAACEPRTRARSALALLVAANGLDCLLNVPAAAAVVSSWAALVHGSPAAARALCKFSAASGQLTAVLQTLAVLVLVLDRCLSLSEPHGSSSTFSLVPGRAGAGAGHAPRGRCAAAASAATWGLLWAAGPLALALAVPIATAASVRMFPTRYACGLVRLGGEPPWPGLLVLLLGYLSPWAGLVLGVSLAARRAALQRWRRRQLELAAQQQGRMQGVGASGAPSAGLAFSLVDTPLGRLSLDEYGALVLASALVGMYLAMLVPGILSTQVLQVMTLKPRTAHGPEDLWPVSTGTYETVLVWLRMQFAVVSPGVIAVLSKDVRKRVLEILQGLYHCCCCCCCCFSRRGNAVGQSLPQRRYGQLAHATPGAAAPTLPPGYLGYGRGRRWARLRQRNADAASRADTAETRVSEGTPVLFATSQGLHLRTLDPRWGPDDEDADDVSTWVGGHGGHGGGGRGSEDAPPPGPPTRHWGDDSRPRYVFQFCDLAVIEDVARGSPEAEASTALVAPAAFGGAAGRRRGIQEVSDREPSLTREELQASLAKPRGLSLSYRKNVRFASVVSEIPIAAPLSSVLEAEAEGVGIGGVWSDPTSSSSAASATDSPVRYVAARPRTRSIELAIVSGDLLQPPPPVTASAPSPLRHVSPGPRSHGVPSLSAALSRASKV